MSESTTTGRRGARRAEAVRRGSPGGRLQVGEYVGSPAAVAAQAVRRAGLRPGLDRSFGCAPELHGQVVAQEPPAGSDLGRNGLVTLYVAAPGAGSAQVEETRASVQEPPALARSLTTTCEEPSPQGTARARRSRKRGSAAIAPRMFEVPPAPIPPGARPFSESRAGQGEEERTQEWSYPSSPRAWDQSEREVPREESVDGQPGEELTHEEFVVHVEDLFAARASAGLPWWRRGSVRPVGGELRIRLAKRPWLVRVMGAMVAVWVVVGVAGVLAGHATETHTASVRSPSASRAASPVIQAHEAFSARGTVAARVQRSAAAPTARAHRGTARHSGVEAGVRPAAVVARPLNRQAAVWPPRAAPAAASTPAASGQERGQGGPFSP